MRKPIAILLTACALLPAAAWSQPVQGAATPPNPGPAGVNPNPSPVQGQSPAAPGTNPNTDINGNPILSSGTAAGTTSPSSGTVTVPWAQSSTGTVGGVGTSTAPAQGWRVPPGVSPSGGSGARP